VVFLRPSRQIPGYTSIVSRSLPSKLFSNSSFISHHTIRLYTASILKLPLKKPHKEKHQRIHQLFRSVPQEMKDFAPLISIKTCLYSNCGSLDYGTLLESGKWISVFRRNSLPPSTGLWSLQA
jgi:hypothetical protein